MKKDEVLKIRAKKTMFPSIFKEPSKKIVSTHPWPKLYPYKIKNETQKNKAHFNISIGSMVSSQFT